MVPTVSSTSAHSMTRDIPNRAGQVVREGENIAQPTSGTEAIRPSAPAAMPVSAPI